MATTTRLQDVPAFSTVPTPAEFTAELAEDEYCARVRGGDFDLGWFQAEPGDGRWGQWGIKAEPSRRGLTLMDIDKASGLYPGEQGPPLAGPRGAGTEPDPSVMNWEISDRWEVWADNLVPLYEEACSRQWSATEDIEWSRMESLPPDMERALCQFNTFLTMAEYLATDVLASWIPKFNTYFHEIKLFIATQAMDEARHTEVFRKRIFANGGGLGMGINLGSHLASQRTLADNLLFGSWGFVSYGVHVAFEGAILSMFRFGEFLGKTDVDKQIFRMVMQDEARHVAYGTMHLKYLIENAPETEKRLEELHHLAAISEMFFTRFFFLHPTTVESCSILAGDGLDGAGDGLEVYKGVYRKMREEYLMRTKQAGLDRTGRCLYPEDLPL